MGAKRKRILLIALGVALLLAAGSVMALVLLGNRESAEAERERRIALARELAESAEEQLSQDPQLAVLLAREAEHTWHSPRSEEMLRRVLLRGSAPPKILSEMQVARIAPSGVTFSPDGKWVMAAYGLNAWVWEVGTAAQVAKLSGQGGEIDRVVISPDGNWIATLASDGSAWVWNTGTWQVAGKLPGEEQLLTTAAFHPDGARLAIVGADKRLRVWKVGSQEQPIALSTFSDGVKSIEYDKEGNRILAVSGYSVYVLHAQDGKEVFTLDLDDGEEQILLTHWTQESRVIIALTTGGLRSWDAVTGKALTEPRGNFTPSDAPCIDLSRDGRWLVTLSASDKISILSADTGHELTSIPVKPDEARKVALSPNGRDIAVAGDGIVRVYTCEVCVGVRELLLLADKRLTRDFTCEERNLYLRAGQLCPTPTR